MKHLYIVITFILFIVKCYSQNILNFKYIDSVTYKAWESKNWDKIITIGNKGIKNGIDYYYLRMRIGIADFEKFNYDSAIINFNKALEYNSSDDVAKEYIYYSLIYSGKNRESEYYAKGFDSLLKQKIKPNLPKIIDKISFEYGKNYVPLFDSLKKIITPPDKRNFRLEKDFSAEYYFYTLNFFHEINKHISIFQSVSLFKYSAFQQLYYNYSTKNINDYFINQIQYYLAPTFFFNKNYSLTVFGNFVNLSANKMKYTYKNLQNIPMPYNPPVYVYQVDSQKYSSNQFVVGLNYVKQYKKDLIDIVISASNLNNNKQLQVSTGYGFYGNIKKTLFFKTTVTLHNENSFSNLILMQLIKFKTTNKIWTDLYGSYGNMYNYNENNGYVILNANNVTLYRVGLKLNVMVLKKLTLNLSYTLSSNDLQLEFTYFSGIIQNKENFSSIKTSNKYYQHLIYGGLLWKF